jgi:site-specific DNA-methyltransferase (adenine-specific)
MLVTWNKPNPTPLSNGNYLPDTEYVVHAFQPSRCFGEFRDKSRFIVYPAQQHNLHPNEKPLAVVSKMILVGTAEGQTILDPFAGSCTTARAAKDLGRKCVCIEREEKYCEIGAKRCAQEVLHLYAEQEVLAP